MKVGTFPYMQPELGIGLNKCVALRKPLIGEANWGKGLHLLGSKKMGPCSNEKRSCGLRSADLLRSRVMGIIG